MCGIFGYVGRPQSLAFLADRVQRLEYRGYDSSGIAYRKNNETGKCVKNIGRMRDVLSQVALDPETETLHMGIGHMRWATHGIPCHQNAHPFEFPDFYLAHNGIVENYEALLRSYPAQHRQSDTDSEAIGWVLTHLLTKRGYSALPEILGNLFHILEGSFACAILFKKEPILAAIRYKSPLILGIEDATGNMMLASDQYGFGEFVGKIYHLKDGESAILTQGQPPRMYAENKERFPPLERVHLTPESLYLHDECYFIKEIYEQPHVFSTEQLTYQTNQVDKVIGPLPHPSHLTLVACGSAYHAGLYGKILMDSLQLFPSEVFVASEFRYRTVPKAANAWYLFISQSGETADTLESARKIEGQEKATLLSITNHATSSLSRLTPLNMAMLCGTEVSVAATKTFAAQLKMLILLANTLGKHSQNQRLVVDPVVFSEFFDQLPTLHQHILAHVDRIHESEALFYLGKDLLLPIAMEGALKVKEIAYVHAEAFPSGELKHGPLALIHKDTCSIILIARDFYPEKGLNTINQIKSRGGQILIITDSERIRDQEPDVTIFLPHRLSYGWIGIPFVLPLQLLAYEVARKKGVDVDRPRNLAKSVTVE